MKSLVLISLIVYTSLCFSSAPKVVFETSLGSFEVELFEKETPKTVKNFLSYVDSKFYDGTIFHRVINNFMIQGGGFTPSMIQKKTNPPIENEATSKLKNEIGTISMARTSDPNSATSQFFINVVDNESLNFRSPQPSDIGYAVFGKVTKGMHIVERIKKVKTGQIGGHSDVPMDPVIIKKVSRKLDSSK